MIHSIQFKNFFSFKDSGILDLTVDGKAPDTDKYFVDKTNQKLAKVQGIFGYNASGKTNALKALSFMQYLIIAAYSEDPEKEIPVMPFAFMKNNSDIVEMSVIFSVSDDIYEYEIALTEKRINKEVLKKKALGKSRFSTLFEREFINNSYSIKDKFSLGFKDTDTRVQRKNASILATALRDEHKETKRIAGFWRSLHSNVFHDGKIDSDYLDIVLAASFFSKNKALKAKADELISKFDIGLSGVDIKEKNNEKGEDFFVINGLHNNEYSLSFRFESAGTKKLFSILANILPVLENGGVAVLDEFDSDLHPIMSEEIINLFFSKETNPHNAQLIFSAHHAPLLNMLDKYNITFAEKNKDGESEIWRLDEMQGVRADDNYYAKYLAGAYGAVPNINL